MMDTYRHTSRIPNRPLPGPESPGAPEMPTYLTPADPTDRVFMKNHSQRVVVCVPTVYDLPTIERSTPVFTHLTVGAHRHDAEDVATVFEAVETHLEPVTTKGFTYGIKVGNDQITSNSTDRLLEDMTHLERLVDEVRESTATPSDATLQGEIHAAGIWTVSDGWFYAEGKSFRATGKMEWTYGILCPEPLADLTEVNRFFTQFADSGPYSQAQWPYRFFQGKGERSSALVGDSSVVRTELVGESADRPVDALVGSNPYYEGRTEIVRNPHDQVPFEFACPLGRTDKFVYSVHTPARPARPDSSYRAHTILAVEPPTIGSLFVWANATTAE